MTCHVGVRVVGDVAVVRTKAHAGPRSITRRAQNQTVREDIAATCCILADRGYSIRQIASIVHIGATQVGRYLRQQSVPALYRAVDIRRGQISRQLPIAQRGTQELLRRLDKAADSVSTHDLIKAVSAAEAAIDHALTPAERREDIQVGYAPNPVAWSVALLAGLVGAQVEQGEARQALTATPLEFEGEVVDVEDGEPAEKPEAEPSGEEARRS